MSHRDFLAVLHSFEHAMLVTQQRDGGLRSRPMAIAESNDTGVLWFISNVHSGKNDELAHDSKVNVAMQGAGRFLSITGKARIVRDTDKAEQLWSEAQRLWFPDGPHDPALALIEVMPSWAEYWDRSGVKGLKFMFAEAEAIVTGHELGDDAGTHGRVALK